jgi:glycosyltransferase involved in cell wall biosynthesis
MGRVLLEAMAARKPIVASAVGGVPHYIRDGDNGILFQSGNVQDLAIKLHLLLSDPNLRMRLGDRAYEIVMTEFDERSFVKAFEGMLSALSGSPRDGRQESISRVAAGRESD